MKTSTADFTPARRAALAALFDTDRRTLDNQIDDVLHLCKLRSFHSAANALAAFRRLIDRRLAVEVRLVAELERAGHCPASVRAHVTDAHARLHGLIEEAWVAVTAWDPATCGGSLQKLRAASAEHERYEQCELFPLLCAHCHDGPPLERMVHELVDP